MAMRNTIRFALRLVLLTVSLVTTAAPTHLVEESATSINEVKPGLFLVDFGKVAFGNLALVAPPNSRSRVTVHFGEALRNGRVDRSPPGTVRYRDTSENIQADEASLIAPGRDKRNTRIGNAKTPPAIQTPEEWDVLIPFRWVEVRGFPGTLQPQHIKRRAAYLRDWDDNASAFHSSNDLLNRIWELSRHSIKATSFAGVYVDGDRERIPYEGDAYLNQLSHYYTDYDKQMARDTFDHLMDFPTWPTEWASHMIFMAHADWMHTADLPWLRNRYEALKSKLLSKRARSDGLVTSNEKEMEKGDLIDWPAAERDNYVFTPLNTVINAFHLRSLDLMGELASALNHDDDAERYRELYNSALLRFQAEFFSRDLGLYRDGIETQHTSLHANLFPLAFDLVPQGHNEALTDWLAQQGMRCSVYAAQYLLEGLFKNGKAAQALDLITAEGDRSWRHMLNNDATITWEAWDVKYKTNLDWNHAWGAAPANLLPRYVLGVEPLTPGWDVALIRPSPGNLTFARGQIPTHRGSIFIDWKLGQSFQLKLHLPPGISAKLELPATAESNGVSLNGKIVAADRIGERWVLENPVSGINTVVVLRK